MNKIGLTLFTVMVLMSTGGRVAWFGGREFNSSVTSLEQEGYTINYITDIDERTLSTYDALVICLTDPSQNQKDVIMDFVEKGGGLLVIYNVIEHPQLEDVLSAYNVENVLQRETDLVFPFLGKETVEELRRRIAVSQRGRGRIIMVGYDPITFQAISFLVDVDNIFSLGLDWLCQDWHVQQTQQMMNKRWVVVLVPLIIGAIVLVGGYIMYTRRKKKKPGREAEKPDDVQEEIRQLKARFVYGEVTRDEYQRELERLERSTK